MKKASKGVEKIEPAEWDFSQIPEDLLQDCLDYELARTLKDVFVPLFEKEKLDGNSSRTGGINVAAPKFGEDGSLLAYYVVRLAKGFPETPFELLDPKIFRNPREKPPSPLFAEAVRKAASSVAPYIEGDRADLVLRVTLNCSKKALLAKFKAILDAIPEDQFKFNEPSGTPPIDRIRADLKALGALRIRQFYTGKEACELRGRTGHPLFSEPREFGRAQTRAEKLLSGLRNKFQP